MTLPLNRMTPEERERLCYAEGFTEAASLLAQLDDAENERDQLTEDIEDENRIPVRYFVMDWDSEDTEPEEVDEFEFVKATGRITYERHTIRENGVNQICLTKGLDE